MIREQIGPILRPHRRLILVAAVAMIGATAVSLAAPLLTKVAIDRGIEQHDAKVINAVALVYLVLVLARPVLERVIVLASARAGERFLGDLRVAAFDKLQHLSLPFFEQTRTGVLVSRLTNDVQTLTTFTRMVLVEVVGSVLLFVVTLVILVTLSPELSLVMLVSVPLLVWSSLRYGKRSRPAFLALRDRVAETMSELQEGLTGVRVLQSYRRETDRYASYRVRSRAQVAAWRRISLVNIGFFPMIAFAQSLALAAVLVVGGYLERNGKVSVGTIVAFGLYLISLFDPIARLGDWYTEFQSGRAALTKIAALLAEPTTVSGGAEALPATGALAVDGVTFAYDGKAPAVAGISLAVAEGEHLALVGATGAGKSTLAKLFVRFYDPDEGGVSFAGVDLRDATLDGHAPPYRLRAAGGASLLGVDRRQRAAGGARGDRRRRTRCTRGDRRARPLRAPARRVGHRCPLARRAAVGRRASAGVDRPRRARPTRR